MPLTYTEPDMFTEKMLAAMMDKFHPELSKAGAKIGILMAVAEKNEAGETIGAPLKFGGYPAQAVIQITSYKNRALGMPDAVIVIDDNNWGDLTAEKREALLDITSFNPSSLKRIRRPKRWSPTIRIGQR